MTPNGIAVGRPSRSGGRSPTTLGVMIYVNFENVPLDFE